MHHLTFSVHRNESHQSLWEKQEAHRNAILEQNIPGHLFLVEHPPTITLGRAEKGQNLKKDLSWFKDHGFDVAEVNRGGMVTYHGPGQLVAYPVIAITNWKWGIKDYICRLESTMIDTLKTYDIEAIRQKENPGVYVDGKKIGSVGIHLRKFVSIHGLALNICPDLSHFQMFTPCGIQEIQMTSIHSLGQHPTFDEVINVYQRVFENHFQTKMTTK